MRFAEQTAEQLVEVLTIVSYSSLHGLVEQNVDIPVPFGCDRVGGGLLGLHPGQSSTMFGGAEHFPATTAEQIVDIPVPRDSRVLHPASSSSGLPGTANQGFSSHFSPRGKSATLGRHSGSELSADFTSSTPAAEQGGFLHGCSWCVDAVSRWLVETSGARIQKSGGLGEGWDGALVVRQPTFAFGRISSPMCSRSSHL